MTIDEAIQHCKEQVQEQAKKGCYSCAEEHQQLVEWLKELKVSRSENPNTCGDAVSRAIVQEEITKSIELKENPYQLWYRIQALPSVTPQPCGDAISRQAMLDGLASIAKAKAKSDAQKSLMGRVMFFTEQLPSVTPEQRIEQRIGRWIPTGYDGYADGNPVYDWWECSECGWEHTGDEESLTAFCPNCGCKMREVEE